MAGTKKNSNSPTLVVLYALGFMHLQIAFLTIMIGPSVLIPYNITMFNETKTDITSDDVKRHSKTIFNSVAYDNEILTPDSGKEYKDFPKEAYIPLLMFVYSFITGIMAIISGIKSCYMHNSIISFFLASVLSAIISLMAVGVMIGFLSEQISFSDLTYPSTFRKEPDINVVKNILLLIFAFVEFIWSILSCVYCYQLANNPDYLADDDNEQLEVKEKLYGVYENMLMPDILPECAFVTERKDKSLNI